MARERINIRHQKPALDYRFPLWTSGPLPIPRILHCQAMIQVKASHLWASKSTQQWSSCGQSACATQLFLTGNPVPETKGRNISQRQPLQNFSQQNAIEKIWINEDRYRKDPRNQIIISTETNHKPRRT
jgi:hypothetical protein